MSKIYDVLEEATEVLKQKPLLRRVEGTAIVSGDLHGDYDALKRLIKIRKLTKANNLVLLGDFVDRGEKQLEVIYKIAKLVIKDKNFFPLRGNHEDEKICQNYGFSDVVFANSLDLDPFLDFFAELPIAAVSNNSFMCHGGLPVRDFDISEVLNYPRLATLLDGDRYGDLSNMLQLLWNDPIDGNPIDEKRAHLPSFRGVAGSYVFGNPVTRSFLKENDLKFLLRAHQVFSQGAKWMHGDNILSLFTSNSGPYAKQNINRKCAYLDLSDKGIVKKDVRLLELDRV